MKWLHPRGTSRERTPITRRTTQSEAKALYGHGGVRNNGNGDKAQPKKLFQRRSSSQASTDSSSSSSSSSSASSSVVAGAAAAKSNRTSGARESKRASRRSGGNSALPPPHATSTPSSTPSGSGAGTDTRGKAETRATDNPSVAATPPPAAGVRPPRTRTPSPPPSAPAGRLADRIRTLRERCCLGLGADAFERAYGYLKVTNMFIWGCVAFVLACGSVSEPKLSTWGLDRSFQGLQQARIVALRDESGGTWFAFH